MSAIDIIVAGMILVTKQEYRPTADSARYESYKAYAKDIQSAVQDPLDGLPFSGPAAEQASEDALVAIAHNESSFREDVRDCTRKGDGGNSISGFQLYRGSSWQKRSQKEICQDPVLAAKLALNILKMYAWVPKVENLFGGYARGTTTVPNAASTRQSDAFQKLVREHGIKIVKKKGEPKLYAEYLEPEVVSFLDAPPLWSFSVPAK